MIDNFFLSLVIIFCGSAFIATIALFTRQALIIGYILFGAIVGPYGFKLINDPKLIAEIAEIGIVFLLFLVGLNLPPNKLVSIFKETLFITLISCTTFFAVGFIVATSIGATMIESIIVGISCAFSSTIIGIKLLPTTVLHHRRLGEIIISVLLLQDLIAIIALLGISYDSSVSISRTFLALPLFLMCAFLGERFIFRPLLRRFDRIQEYVFLMVLAWSLGIAEFAKIMGLSLETGAFIAGVALATHPVAQIFAEQLKPLRDFFLVLFFFAVGAGFNYVAATPVLIPGLILATILLILKPMVFSYLMQSHTENIARSKEVGARLGQMSEFSLLIIAIAIQHELIRDQFAYLTQVATVATLMFSAFWIVRTYPTPVATKKELRRD